MSWTWWRNLGLLAISMEDLERAITNISVKQHLKEVKEELMFFDEQTGFNLAAKMVLDRAYRNTAMKCSKGSSFKNIPKAKTSHLC